MDMMMQGVRPDCDSMEDIWIWIRISYRSNRRGRGSVEVDAPVQQHHVLIDRQGSLLVPDVVLECQCSQVKGGDLLVDGAELWSSSSGDGGIQSVLGA